ncbi:hypothetical protein LTR95_012119 [Oleoguttula sp. CCFEE 5521]
MRSSEQILETAARVGSIDMLESLRGVKRIVHTGFPIPPSPSPRHINRAPTPIIDPEVVAATPPAQIADSDDHDDLPEAGTDELAAPNGSQSSTKENDEPVRNDITTAKPPVPRFDDTPSTLRPDPPTTSRSSSISGDLTPLPPDLLAIYNFSTHLLQRDFAHSPPYTLQRLAELVLHPRQHYTRLSPFLRALDRIISVSSPLSDFPLPTHPNGTNSFLTNGDTPSEELGSDESLGGALLTPIPWLRQNSAGQGGSQGGDGELHSEGMESIQGPNGVGSIETVSVVVNGISSSAGHNSSPGNSLPASPTLSEQSDASTGSSAGSAGTMEGMLREQGGVTQGELLRLEQEAGVVPVAQQRAGATGGTASGEEGEAPHARGPEEVGMEDMGPQHGGAGMLGTGIDLEAAVGRARSPQPVVESAPMENVDAVLHDAVMADAVGTGTVHEDTDANDEKAAGDAIIANADGEAVEEK